MSTVAAGPYEHTGAYADAEFFDTTGTQPGFCAECEHAPCVAGALKRCTQRPRVIVSLRLRAEVLDLLDGVDPRCPLRRILIDAVWAIANATRGQDIWAICALDDLVLIRASLRELVS